MGIMIRWCDEWKLGRRGWLGVKQEGGEGRQRGEEEEGVAGFETGRRGRKRGGEEEGVAGCETGRRGRERGGRGERSGREGTNGGGSS